MMNRKVKDIYVYIASPAHKFPLKFTVRFPDNCEKDYIIDESDFRAARCSVRDYVENTIMDYYDSLGEQAPTFRLFFT